MERFCIDTHLLWGRLRDFRTGPRNTLARQKRAGASKTGPTANRGRDTAAKRYNRVRYADGGPESSSSLLEIRRSRAIARVRTTAIKRAAHQTCPDRLRAKLGE